MNGILLGGRGRVRAYPAAQTTTTGGGGSGGYTPPQWPALEADELYRAALNSTTTPFNDVSGNARNGVVVGTLRYIGSHFLDKCAAYASGGNWNVMGHAALRLNTTWTLDVVFEMPENNVVQGVVQISAVGGGNLKGGLQWNGTGSLQTWIPAGWQTITSSNNYFYGTQQHRLMAATIQWGADNIVRAWINGFLFYTSGVLVPPAIVGDEGLVSINGAAIHFVRYRGAAPADPHSWHSAALYGS